MTRAAAGSSKLLEILDGYRAVQALYVAATLGLADLLKDGPMESAAIARATGADPRSLHRLLRALASLDVLEEKGDGRFALASLGHELRSDVPGSLRAAVVYYGGRRNWTSWGRLLESVKTGKPAFGAWSPGAFREMAERDPDGAAALNEAMAALGGPANASIAAAYDFSKVGMLVDVGGGYGTLLGAVLAAHPRLRGVLFDIPPVIAGARGRIEAAGLADRCELVAGDAFEAVPEGGDAYVLKWVLHDWDDELSLRILKSCRMAMRHGAVLLIVERVLPQRAEPTAGTATKFLSDLNMLLLTAGRERTAGEYRTLLAAAGFEPGRVIRTPTPHCIIEARG